MLDRILVVIEPGEAVTIDQVAARCGYGNSTVMAALPKLVNEGRLYRAAHGLYSLQKGYKAPDPDADAVLAAFRQHSFSTARWAREQVGFEGPRFQKALAGLVADKRLNRVRKGVYAPTTLKG